MLTVRAMHGSRFIALRERVGDGGEGFSIRNDASGLIVNAFFDINVHVYCVGVCVYVFVCVGVCSVQNTILSE